MNTNLNTNLKFLKATGKVEIPDDLDYGREVILKGTVVKKEGFDNQNGTINITYTAKIYEVETEVANA
jgi:hypothetical protein